jgi:hypothetical protein
MDDLGYYGWFIMENPIKMDDLVYYGWFIMEIPLTGKWVI